MINFSTLKGLTIPVDRIRATLKRGMNYTGAVVHAWIVVDGQTYYAEETPTDIPVKAGATITCFVTTGVQVNGQYVFQGSGSYEYTVSSNTTIEITNAHISDTQYIGLILITETPVTGVVTQIADASGRVLWSAEPPMLKVTVLSDLYGYNSSDCGTSADYSTPDGVVGSLDLAGVYEVPLGTSITLEAWDDEKGAYIYVNGVCVEYRSARDQKVNVKYGHTLNTDAVIIGKYHGGANIELTEIPKGCALVTVNGDGYQYNSDESQYAWVEPIIMGDTSDIYTTRTFVVELGTVLTLRVYQDKSSVGGYISVNGTTVATGSKDLSYSYTLNGNITISLNTKKAASGTTDGYIYGGTISLTET